MYTELLQNICNVQDSTNGELTNPVDEKLVGVLRSFWFFDVVA